jgi:Zn-dependent protease with chaperone function
MTIRIVHAIRSCTLVLGCALLATLTHGQAPATPGPDDAAMARAADVYYTRTLETAHLRKALDVDRGRLVAMRLAVASLIEPARMLRPKVAGWSWSVHLETRDEPVAYCLPGGKILVSTGLFDRLSLSMPEFAALLAHAMAHAVAGEEAREVLQEFARSGETMSPDPNRTVVMLAEILARTVASMRHDEASERAADALGLELMASAGLDPRPTIDAWHKVAGASSATPPTFPALHPMWPERIAELEARMPAMVALYEKTLRERPNEPPPKKRRPSRSR